MSERRPSNSELKLGRIEHEESGRERDEGVLELFDGDESPQREDAPTAREDARE